MKHSTPQHTIRATDHDDLRRDAVRPEDGTDRGARDRMGRDTRRRWDEPVHRTLPRARFE